MRDFLALRHQLPRHFDRDRCPDAIPADDVGSARRVRLHCLDVMRGHFLHREHLLLAEAVRGKRVERLVFAEELGQLAAIKTTAGPVANAGRKEEDESPSPGR